MEQTENKKEGAKFCSRGKLIAIIVAAVLIIAAVVVLIAVLSKPKPVKNESYEAPIKYYEDYLNGRYTDVLKMYRDFRGGIAEDSVQSAVNVLMKSDWYKEQIDSVNVYFKSANEYYKETYGNNPVMTIAIDSADELSQEELSSYKEKMISSATKTYDELIVELEEYEEKMWDNFEDIVGLTEKQGEALLKACRKIVSELESIDVTEGYVLNCTITLTEEETSEPQTQEDSTVVLKVNDSWVMYDMFILGFEIYDFYGGQ